MTPVPGPTHDPSLRSWVESANRPGGCFPVQNLPYGAIRHQGRVVLAVAIGDEFLDLLACAELGRLAGLSEAVISACRASTLNPLMALGSGAWSQLRARLSELLRADTPHPRLPASALGHRAGAEAVIPMAIGDYTDFYASIHHARNVGSMFRPDNPLLPNYKWVPIGYHGRASSVVVSGTPVHRPVGQVMEEGADGPAVRPTRRLDYECELGLVVGTGNRLGRPVPIGDASGAIFGCCLLNDWSARDIQAWEYQPLGPFLSKNFATTISPWIVTTEALAPFRTSLAPRPSEDPRPLPYLDDEADRSSGAIDLALEVHLQTARMRERSERPVRLSRSNARDLYWTPGQLLAHHSSNGCNLQPGDLLGSGTVSGADEDARGCLLELT
ncbi:MAG TPA: fumarylacetoacetase, partial [Gemmatimonadales bacterium]|nr:fumarylacetoacetase [Gemmatimonadales bacterium]